MLCCGSACSSPARALAGAPSAASLFTAWRGAHVEQASKLASRHVQGGSDAHAALHALVALAVQRRKQGAQVAVWAPVRGNLRSRTVLAQVACLLWN